MFTLLDISKLQSFNEKHTEFMSHLKQNIDNYKLFGKYPIDKNKPISIEFLDELQELYINNTTNLCCNFQESSVHEHHFQSLKEIIKNNQIPDEIIQKMDDRNAEVAKIFNTNGPDAALDVMTQGLRNGTMDYATMRSLYG